MKINFNSVKGFSLAMVVCFGLLGVLTFVAGFWNPHQFGLTLVCTVLVVAGFSDLKKEDEN